MSDDFYVATATGLSISTGLASSDFKHFRKMVIAGILATDMTKHFEMCKHAEHFSKDELLSHRPPVWLVELLVHASDLIGQALPLVQAREWSDRVLEEFSAQVAMEKEANLPFAPYMDNLEDAEAALKVQVGFLNFVLLPLWLPNCRIYRYVYFVCVLMGMIVYVDSLNANFNTYKSELETYESKDVLKSNSDKSLDLDVRPASPTQASTEVEQK